MLKGKNSCLFNLWGTPYIPQSTQQLNGQKSLGGFSNFSVYFPFQSVAKHTSKIQGQSAGQKSLPLNVPRAVAHNKPRGLHAADGTSRQL